MSYEAEISRANPTCFLFLVDQSGSMAERFGGETGKSKAEGVAESVNRFFQTLVARCAKGQQILDRYYVGVIGYGGEVRMGLPIEGLAGDVLQPISRIAVSPLRIEDRVQCVDDGAGGRRQQRIKFPVWFEPRAEGKTPMCAALRAARGVIEGFIGRYPKCFPPIVINVSDGMATDGPFEPEALALWRLASQDGNAMLFNLHVSARANRRSCSPTATSACPTSTARRLFSMSSPLPPPMLRQSGICEASLRRGPGGSPSMPIWPRSSCSWTLGRGSGAFSGDFMSKSSRAFWLPRGGHSPAEYEDAFAMDEVAGRYGVADGASEGCFTGDWARLLVEGFVRGGDITSWPASLPALQEQWDTEVRAQDLPWYAETGVSQGACSTFLGLLLATPAGSNAPATATARSLESSRHTPCAVRQTGQGCGGRHTDHASMVPGACYFGAVAVGDTCLLHTRGGTLLRAFPLDRSQQFHNFPKLVGSRMPVEAVRARQTLWLDGCGQPGDRLWMMTDALSQFCLARSRRAAILGTNWNRWPPPRISPLPPTMLHTVPGEG